jgi:hypothetical protein
MVTTSPIPEWIDPEFPKQFVKQTDRGAAVLGGALAEFHLEQLILDRMRSDLSSERKERLFEGFGPLAGFAPKIEVAYAFGLIGPESRIDFRLVNDIRNLFAHEFRGSELTFDHPDVRKKCDSFKTMNKTAPSRGEPQITNRDKFVGTVYFLASQCYGEITANKQTKFTTMFLS